MSVALKPLHAVHGVLVAGIVLLAYGAWLICTFAGGHDARDFTIINRATVEHCATSRVIHVDPRYHYPPNSIGYDGAFYYLIALDPLHAACYLDAPAYRYGRILYPLTARLLALGRSGWIPFTLLLTNLLALAGGTLALATWLSRKGLSPWFALLFGLYPGLFVSLWRDLTEPLSCALVALAVLLYDGGGRRHIVWAGLAFALASLARETAILFPIVYGLSLLAGKRWRDGAGLLAISILPVAVYRLAILLWLGESSELAPSWIPFGGLIHWWPWTGERLDIVLSIVAPALLCAGLALWVLFRGVRAAEVWTILANVLVLVVMLIWQTYAEYYAAGRATAAVPLAVILALPVLERVTGRNRSWLWLASFFWLAPWYFLFPQAVQWTNVGL